MKSKVELITPAKARAYLKQNDNFRKPNEKKIQNFAAEMLSGDWEENGESIKFVGKGSGERFRDGQNRLMAIDRTGVSIPMVVVRECAGSAFVDLGEKRNLCQHLTHLKVKYAVNMATAVGNLLSYKQNATGEIEKSARVTHKMRIDCFDKHQRALKKWVPRIHNYKECMWKAPIAAVLVIGTTPRDYKDAKEEFVHYCATGDGLEPLDAINLLRKVQIDSIRRKIRYPSRHRIALVVKAWNAHRERVLWDSKRLFFVDSGRNREEYPVAL